jgi:integrase
VDSILKAVKGSVRSPRSEGGSWAYRIDVPGVRGQARRQVQMAGFSSEADARIAMEAAVGECENVRSVRRPPDTVGGFLSDRWPRGIRREVAESALSNYVTVVNIYVLPTLGDVRLTRLSATQIDGLYAHLLSNGSRGGGPLAPATVGQVHRTLRRALNDAVRWGLLDRNPVVDSKLPRSSAAELTVWTPSEVAKFLEFTRDDRLGVLWEFALHTGLRRGELAGLRWRDVDLSSGKVSIVVQRTTDGYRVVMVEPKAGSRRVVQLASVVLARVRAHHENRMQNEQLSG